MMNVSVVMATYNGQKFLNEQIDSIITQLEEDDELIISDDGSNDNTIQIISSYLNDKRIKMYDNQNRGIVKNFENAINKSKNEIIIFSDQDDVWLPNKVKYIKNEFNNNKADLVVTGMKRVNSELNEFQLIKTDKSEWKKGFIKNLIKNTYTGCCMSIHRKQLEFVLPFPSYIPMHDVWIGLICEIRKCNIKFIDEPLILYRRHSNTVTTNKRNKFKKIFYSRISLIINIINRMKKIRGGFK